MGALNAILDMVNDQRGFDFSGYRRAMLERRIQKRLYSTNCKNTDEYLHYLSQHPFELDELVDVFTIKVSEFFRNSMVFDFIKKLIIPELASTNTKNQENNLRIWSAGCSHGEEPYSMTILLNELLEKEAGLFNFKIFATDIDKKALSVAEKATYSLRSVGSVKYAVLNKYFTQEKDLFVLDREIVKKVQFSFYDLLDKKSSVPSSSIFGGFDIVLCRNVLIYFEMPSQQIIFEKLYKSLKPNGYLILGEAEMPVEGFKDKFKRVNNYCKIYRKKT